MLRDLTRRKMKIIILYARHACNNNILYIADHDPLYTRENVFLVSGPETKLFRVLVRFFLYIYYAYR